MYKSLSVPLQLHSIFSRKSVCIVGNGPIDLCTEPLDPAHFDHVICFNNYQFSESLCLKPTIYVSNGRRETRETTLLMQKQNVLTLSTAKTQDPQALSDLDLSDLAKELSQTLGCWPSSGLITIAAAIQGQARHIHLTGFDFAPPLKQDPRLPSRKAPSHFWHNWLGERRVLSQLLTQATQSQTTVILPPSLQSLAKQPAPNAELPIAVVIPTHNRPELLKERALQSVLQQSHPPSIILVVDDSQDELKTTVQVIVASTNDEANLPVHYLENERTPGLSGALNTAIAWLTHNLPNAIVAPLDDDDAWEPSYLASIHRKFVTGAEVVVSRIFRHEGGPEPRVPTTPQELTPETFLVGNPHVQGSNTSFRLSTVLEAGGYDEALMSCTDRDLMIRLLDLTGLKVSVVWTPLVHHHAEPNRDRLSSPRSTAKINGLRHFHAKWRHRMNEEQAQQARDRARRYFGFDPQAPQNSLAIQPPQNEVELKPLAKKQLRFDVGVALAGGDPLGADFLAEIKKIVPDTRASSVRLVVGRTPNNEPRIDVALKELVALGVTVVETPLAPGPDGRRASIAVNRRRIRQKLLELSGEPDVTWLADDDLRLDVPTLADDNSLTYKDSNLLGNLLVLCDQGLDVVLGKYAWAPPIPEAFAMRGQLLDILRLLEALQSNSTRKARDHILRWQSSARSEFYHDLSEHDRKQRESAQPTPFLIEAEVTSTLKTLSARMQGLLHGDPVTRPLLATLHQNPQALVDSCSPSDACGGTTFVFNRSLLRVDVQVPTLAGRKTRRGDMAWAIAAREQHGAQIVLADIFLRHARGEACAPLNFAKVSDDILGHGACAALRASFQDDLNDSAITKVFTKRCETRLTEFTLSAARVRGLLRTLERFFFIVSKRRDQTPSWLTDHETGNAVEELVTVFRRLQETFSERTVHSVRERVTTAMQDTNGLLTWLRLATNDGRLS